MRDIFFKIAHNDSASSSGAKFRFISRAILITINRETSTMKNKRFRKFYPSNTFLSLLILTHSVLAQKTSVVQDSSGDDGWWWYITLFVLAVCLAAVVVWKLKSKKAENVKAAKAEKSKKAEDIWDTSSLDADKELEWLRKNQNLVDKKRKRHSLPMTAVNQTAGRNNGDAAEMAETEGASIELPVFDFKTVETAKPFERLPISNDESLINAIEQTHDEYEEDESVRELAVRILTAFKTRNSVEALSQVALYDLSSSLRSKAVLTLTEFDHESVFETILVACADPSREVRAAAARGLTRLSFDRTDAWARIAESNEEGRIRQSARAAVESGFVERSFDRLVHPDKQYAYEAFVLLSLLIKAGEMEPIFTALKTNKNADVRRAILHLFKVADDPNALAELGGLLEDRSLPGDVKMEIDDAVKELALAAA